MVQVSQAPQNQRLVFLQPVQNQNGQITYIQKSVPNQQSVVLLFDFNKKIFKSSLIQTSLANIRPNQQVQPIKIESTMSDEVLKSLVSSVTFLVP